MLDEAEIRAAGMGAFAAVAQGSDQPAKLIALSYEPPAAAGGRRLALIGKAVTFDSGGLWLKPTASQITMKFDMAGGAAVIETAAALAQLRRTRPGARRGRRDREHDQRRRDATRGHPRGARRDHDRDEQLRRRGPARARRLHHLGQARGVRRDRRHRHADRRGRGRARLRVRRTDVQRRRTGGARGALRRSDRRAAVAAAARRALRRDGQGALRAADEPHRGARRGRDHRRRTAAPLRRRHPVGPPGHRRRRRQRPRPPTWTRAERVSACGC